MNETFPRLTRSRRRGRLRLILAFGCGLNDSLVAARGIGPDSRYPAGLGQDELDVNCRCFERRRGCNPRGKWEQAPCEPWISEGFLRYGVERFKFGCEGFPVAEFARIRANSHYPRTLGEFSYNNLDRAHVMQCGVLSK